MILFKTDYLEIAYDEEQNYIETCWLTFATSVQYREGLAAYLDVITNYDVKKWLGDYRKARVVRIEDELWTTDEWAPRFMPIATKIVKMAKVSSQDIFSEISSNKIKTNLDLNRLPFKFKEFDIYEDAKAWVLG